MDILAQSSLFVAILSFAVGSAVFARNVGNRLFQLFAALTALISGWAVSFFLSSVYGYGHLYRVHLAANVWLAPLALAFIRSLVKTQDRFSRALGRLALGLAIALSGALLFHLERVPWVLELIYFSPGVIVLQILRVVWIDRQVRRGGAQTPLLTAAVALDQRTLIYIGGLLVLCTSVMDHLPWLGQVVPSLGNLALTVYIFFLGQAITQQKFLNLEAMLSRFLVVLVMALTLTLVYSLLFTWIENRPALFFLNSFIVSFLLLMLLEPIRRLVRYLTLRLLTQKHLRLEQILRDAQRHLAEAADPNRLFDVILATASRCLEPESGALLVLRGDGTRYQQVHSIGAAGVRLPEIVVTHSLIEHCLGLQQKGKLPVLLDQILQDEIARSTSRKQREYFEGLMQGLLALNCNLLIPLLDSDRFERGTRAERGPRAARALGLVALKVPQPPEPWGDNWGFLPVIYPFFEQAAQTMRSLEVFVQQRKKERLATLGEMAAGLAHEIRNPLGAIKGAAQFLQPAHDEQERPDSRFLGIIIEEVDRLNRVVTQFLDYSKPPVTSLRPTDLTRLVEGTVQLMQPAVPAGIRMEFERPAQGIQVEASPEQLHQVLINLIQNSITALNSRVDGSVGESSRMIRVRVDSNRHTRPWQAVVQIEDTGPGIKKEHLEKLFIPFFTTSPGGTGLGLSISQKIIEAHRGRIEVATEEGRFTRISVILPEVAGDPAASRKPMASGAGARTRLVAEGGGEAVR